MDTQVCSDCGGCQTIVSDQNELSTGPSGSSTSGHIGEYDGCIDCRRQQKKS